MAFDEIETVALGDEVERWSEASRVASSETVVGADGACWGAALGFEAASTGSSVKRPIAKETIQRARMITKNLILRIIPPVILVLWGMKRFKIPSRAPVDGISFHYSTDVHFCQ